MSHSGLLQNEFPVHRSGSFFGLDHFLVISQRHNTSMAASSTIKNASGHNQAKREVTSQDFLQSLSKSKVRILMKVFYSKNLFVSRIRIDMRTFIPTHPMRLLKDKGPFPAQSRHTLLRPSNLRLDSSLLLSLSSRFKYHFRCLLHLQSPLASPIHQQALLLRLHLLRLPLDL